MDKYMTFCGLYCGACASMIIHEQHSDDPSVAHTPVPNDESACKGCNHDGLDNCEIVLCNKQHGTECCAFCPELPCHTIQNFNDTEWPHHADVIENLYRIKSIGIKAWLAEQSKRWRCQNCGTRSHWYQNKCENCGQNLTGMYQL